MTDGGRQAVARNAFHCQVVAVTRAAVNAEVILRQASGAPALTHALDQITKPTQ
ncbi:hypothetical protein [Rhodopila sp.]|uniref:hypothetical protein n=1 Tax=Rhodopila sp. TaxID=2480087 RepID=UPI002BDAD343|nr:hypothetical protein [Rhodopila sp.]HVZ10211.1 hypothetical protein [Rhodopila sp.]